MSRVTLPFGGRELSLEIPSGNLIEVLSPHPAHPLENLEAEIEAALDRPLGQPPLEEWVKPKDRVLIVSDDNTRLTPAHKIIPPLLARLNRAGVADDRISCLMALGTHRYMTEEEMRAKVGAEVYGRIRVFNHLWREEKELVDLGRSSQGTPLVVNRAVREAEVIIGLGAVVPHHIPGFSGSSKIIQPGICGPGTTAETHLLSTQAGGDSFLGIEDNPVRREMDDMAELCRMRTIFNVVMSSEGGVVGLFFGELKIVFEEAVKLARRIYGVDFHHPPDIVLTNAYPCELDFWQSHKAQYPAQRMVKPGGTIIISTPAPEGVSPVHTELLEFTSWPSAEIKAAFRRGELKNGVATALAVAWAMVREKASVITFSPGIPLKDKAALGHCHAENLEEALAMAFEEQGTGAGVTVLTHAPDMLPLKAF